GALPPAPLPGPARRHDAAPRAPEARPPDGAPPTPARVIRPRRGDLVVATVCAVVVVLVTADVLAGGLLTYLDEAISDQLPSSDDAPTWTHVVGLLGNAGVGGAAVLAAAIATMHGL